MLGIVSGMQREELIGKLLSIQPALEAEGVKHMALFGSRARGDHMPQSDIDILLDVERDTRFSILNLVGVEHLVKDAVGVTANAVLERSLDEAFQASIRPDVLKIF